MSLVCAQCSRVNPTEAAYCYYDGAALAGRAGGPINAGSAPFPNQFVFPNGLACRNFDQLAMACQEHWPAAIDLLKQGFLGSFLGGMGRIDLALAAQEAAKFPDLDRGLDQLLAKLPTQAIQPPKLQAEPSEINLGQVKVGAGRATEIHLTNVGMRLLYGTVTSDCKWLTLGDGQGHAEKMFQFGADAVIPVQVRGQHLRAGNKAQEGHLVIDSNGGTTTVTFRADVPITPFEGEMFAGAVTPRQVAEKAKANPKDASPYFEKGDIARWYAANGWPYPVQGPIMPGMGAIQQFFEALGVAKAPKVEVNPKSLVLQGAVGKTLNASLELSEIAGKDRKKFVYGWAICDQAWVEIGKSKLTGKSAIIPITLRIPSPCPPTLEATINVVGNGSTKIAVPLKVTVAGGKAGVVLKPREEDYVKLEILDEPAPVRAKTTPMPVQVVDERRAAPEIDEPMPFAAAASSEALIVHTPQPSAAPAPIEEENPFAITSSPAPIGGTAALTIASPTVPARKPAPLLMRLLIHLIPIVLIFMCLLSILVWDAVNIVKGGGKGDGKGGDDKGSGANNQDGPVDWSDIHRKPFVKVQFDEGKAEKDATDSMNFAIHKIDPDDDRIPSVKLNYYENGLGNTVVARIDGKDKLFGLAGAAGTGKWDKEFEKAGKPAGRYGGTGKKRAFIFNEGIVVTQTVTVEPGEPDDTGKRPLNTCLVRYQIKNADKTNPHKVGLRVLMDTCIGNEDGVPFILPGSKELVTTCKEFKDAEVPGFVQVRQNPDPALPPGIILHLNLRVSEAFEPPGHFLMSRYPGRPNKMHEKWDVALKDMKISGEIQGDSCVALYWKEQQLPVNATRELGFTYGLGVMSSSALPGKLDVTVGGAFHIGGELTVVALVADPKALAVTLDLPKHLELIDKKTMTQIPTLPRLTSDNKQYPATLTWRVRAISAGANELTVSTDNGLKKSRKVTITAKSLFN